MAAGAYYTPFPLTCQVKTSPAPVAGNSSWCQDAPPGYLNYNILDWNRLFPSYAVPVPTFCQAPTPPQPPIQGPGGTPQVGTGDSLSAARQVGIGFTNAQGQPAGAGRTGVTKKKPQVAKKPITGSPPVPPEEGCGDAMAVIDGENNRSQFVSSGGSDTGFGFGSIDQMAQPNVIGMTPLSIYGSNGIPTFANDAIIDIRDEWNGHAVHSFHEGTGKGILCFHPPELQDYMLHGSGQNGADSRWPTTLSCASVMLLNHTRADGFTGERAITYLSFGVPLKGVVTPGLGAYFNLNASNVLELNFTNASGDDDSTLSGFIINGDLTANVQKTFYENMGNVAFVKAEFMGNTARDEGVISVPGGTGSIIGSGALDKTDHPGVWALNTGIGTDGRIFIIGSATNGFHYGGGIVRCATWVKTPPTLSDAVNEYVLRAGTFSIALPNTILFGIGFEYQFDQNGGRWQGITENAAESSLDTGITLVVDTWYKLEFEVNAAATSVEFFIDDVSVGTLSTAANIPSGIVIDNFYNTHIMKLAGTSARVFYVDAAHLYMEINR